MLETSLLKLAKKNLIEKCPIGLLIDISHDCFYIFNGKRLSFQSTRPTLFYDFELP